MPSDISADIRALVAERAGFRCEYCLLHQEDTWSPHQVDHIVSRKHGGHSKAENLAYCCLRCNLWKGTDIGSLTPGTGVLVRFYHPRKDRWKNHFKMMDAVIEPLTAEGDVTISVLRFNMDKRVVERRMLLAARRYQPPQMQKF